MIRRTRSSRHPLLLAAIAAALPLVIWAVAVRGGPALTKDTRLGSMVDPPLRGLAKKRQKILETIPGDPSVLVNVRHEHLPATHDMTLLGKAALPALERGLAHNVKPGIRMRIASVLTELANHHSRNALTAALKDWNSSVRRQAVLGLAAIGDPKSEPALLRVIDDPEEGDWVKNAAIRALGRIGAQKSAQRLLKLLTPNKDPSENKKNTSQRRAALSSLWDLRFHLNRNQVRRALIQALGSEDAYMVVFAAAGAAELRDPDARVRAALVKRIRDKNANVRNLAVYALGEIGHRGSIKALRARLPSARSARLLNNIAFALRKMGDQRVMTLLGKLLRHRLAIIRLNAAFVLGDIGDPAAIPLLAAALRDPNDFVRASTIAALGRVGNRKAIVHLTPLLGSKNLNLRMETLFALNRITKGSYNNRIAKDLLWHKRPSVRRAAAIELARRKDRRAIPALQLCYATRKCNAWTFAKGLESISSWRATGPLVTGYSRKFGSYGGGANRLLRALGKRKLKPGHRSVLRSLLTISRWKRSQRRALLRLLGRLGDRTARGAYWAHLKSRDALTRLNASYALANQGYAQGRKRLITSLSQAAPRIKRGTADLLRSLTHQGARAAARTEIQAVLKGHGPFTRLAAAYALTGWDAKSGLKILISTLTSTSRQLRNEAAYYLMRKEIRDHRAIIAQAAKSEKRPAVRGTLSRILRHITPGTLKTGVMDWVNL